MSHYPTLGVMSGHAPSINLYALGRAETRDGITHTAAGDYAAAAVRFSLAADAAETLARTIQTHDAELAAQWRAVSQNRSRLAREATESAGPAVEVTQ